MNSGPRHEKLCILFILISIIPLLFFSSPQTPKITADFPSDHKIEKELWKIINRERELRRLPLLELSSALSDMARQHSLDMANQGEASHLSSNGKTLANRLEDADFYYIDAGENVAFSETFVAEFIHKSLFESGKGHRENMLDPNYTQVGIGIIQRDHKRYYVTQDFLRPLVKKSSEQAGQIILERINTERHSVELPPLKLWKEAEKFAQKLATRKAKGLALPDIPPEFGETLVVFLFMPGLIQEEFLFSDAVNPRYNRGALGIWFGKNRDYPGGIYTLSLLLFAENRQDSLSLSDQRKFILELVNKIRKRFDLKVFILDDGLNGTAQRVAVQAAERTSRNILLFPKHNRYEHLTYGTEDLSLLPASLDSIVKKSRLRKIGIGLVHKKSRSALAGTFFISLILE